MDHHFGFQNLQVDQINQKIAVLCPQLVDYFHRQNCYLQNLRQIPQLQIPFKIKQLRKKEMKKKLLLLDQLGVGYQILTLHLKLLVLFSRIPYFF